MPSSFVGVFKSDIPSGGVGAPRCTTGVLSCATGPASTLPTLHYWVADSACVNNAINAIQQIGYADVHFTAFTSRMTWTQSYGIVAPLTNLDIIPATPAIDNVRGQRRARTTPHHTPGDVPPPPSEPHPDDLCALLETTVGTSVPHQSIHGAERTPAQPRRRYKGSNPR